jgi:hypothetical protein
MRSSGRRGARLTDWQRPLRRVGLSMLAAPAAALKALLRYKPTMNKQEIVARLRENEAAGRNNRRCNRTKEQPRASSGIAVTITRRIQSFIQ